MSKRNVAFVKPDEPSFLKKLKQQIGFKEGPTLETKRRKLTELNYNDDGNDDEETIVREEEQPQIVVLKTGDLDSKQVQEEKKRLQAEENSKPADLTKRVVFRPNSAASASGIKTAAVSSELLNQRNNKLLSFEIEEEEEEEDEFKN